MNKKSTKKTNKIIISIFCLVLVILLIFTISRTTGFADKIFESKDNSTSDLKIMDDVKELNSNLEEINSEEKPIEEFRETETIEIKKVEYKVDEKEIAKQKQFLEFTGKDNIIIEYNYDKPIITKDSEKKDIVTISKLNNLNTPGEPEVPFEVIMIMLPIDKDVDKVTVIPEDKVDIKGTYNLKTGDWQVPISQADKVDISEFEKNKTIFNKYPNNYYSNPSTQIKKGYKFVVFNIYPVEYQQKKQKLSYYPKFTVVVTLKPGEVPKSFRASIEDKKEIQNWVISQKSNLNSEKNLTYERYQEISREVSNKTNLSTLYTYSIGNKKIEDGRNQPNIIPETFSYKYIIVTKREFGPSFQPLITWKTTRPNNPITAKIFYMEDILADSRFSCTGEYNWGDGCGQYNQFNDDAAKLRNFIRFAYTIFGTEYVLLGGDADYENLGPETETEDVIVPSRYIGLLNSNEIILSDMYFSNLDGSFNTENDGVFRFYYNQTDPNTGSSIENTDYLTEVAIGRAPFDNVTEINNWVTKTIAAEQITDYQNLNHLFVGEFLDFGGITHFAGPSLDEIVNGSTNCGINTTGFSEINQNKIYKLYDDYQNYNPPQVYGFSSLELIDLMNIRNPYIINHFGHGNVNFLMKFQIYSSNEEIYGLTAERSFINSQACYSGSFDNKFANDAVSNKDSISEEMLGLENGPFSMITNSRFGHGAAYSLCGQSQIMQRIFWGNAFTNQNKNLGKLNNLSKEKYIVNQGFSYVYLETNLLGDPETKLLLPTVDNKLSVDLFGPILDSVHYQEDFNININLNNLTDITQSNIILRIYLDGQEIYNQSLILNPGGNQISYILNQNLYSSNIGEYKRIKVTVNSNLSGDATYDNVFEKDLFIYNAEFNELNNTNIINIENQIVDCDTSFGQQLFNVNVNKIAYIGSFRFEGGNYILRNCEFISFAGDNYALYFLNNQNIILENNIFKQISIEFRDFNNIDINSNLFYVNYYNSTIYHDPNFITQNSIEYSNVADVIIQNNKFNTFHSTLELNNLRNMYPANYIRHSQRIKFIENKFTGSYGGIFLENVNDINLINNNFYLLRTFFNHGEIGGVYNKYAVAAIIFPSSNLNIINNTVENMHFYLDNVNNVDFNKNTLKNSRLFVSQSNDVVLYKNRSSNAVFDGGLIFRGFDYANARIYIVDSNLLRIVENHICLSPRFDYPGINLLLNCSQLSALNFINNIISSTSIQSLDYCPELLPQHGVNYCYCNEKFAPGGVGCVPDPNYQNTLEMDR